MREQKCTIPFEILIVDNNSTDCTREIVMQAIVLDGPKIRYVFEPKQGITYARNRAIDESLSSTFMAFIDDDEIPQAGLLEAAVNALEDKGADCVGGRVKVTFKDIERPSWLDDELLGFLAEINYGNNAFWINEKVTPIWTANIAYRTEIFNTYEDLRFDERYNRCGTAIGGGEDAIMFRAMLSKHLKMMYEPKMLVEHVVEPWRLKRKYFIKLHYEAGRKYGIHSPTEYERTILGIPPFMLKQVISQWLKALKMYLFRKHGVLRQAMNGVHAIGCIQGRFQRWRNHRIEN